MKTTLKAFAITVGILASLILVCLGLAILFNQQKIAGYLFAAIIILAVVVCTTYNIRDELEKRKVK